MRIVDEDCLYTLEYKLPSMVIEEAAVEKMLTQPKYGK
jgi:hypothetical protein